MGVPSEFEEDVQNENFCENRAKNWYDFFKNTHTKHECKQKKFNRVLYRRGWWVTAPMNYNKLKDS